MCPQIGSTWDSRLKYNGLINSETLLQAEEIILALKTQLLLLKNG
jgi:hypothetical protein